MARTIEGLVAKVGDDSANKGAVSLRQGIAWAFAGNLVYAATQWGQVIAVVRFGVIEDLGELSLAFALTSPLFLMLGLNLRIVIATDSASRFSWDEYVITRFVSYLLAALLGLVATSVLAPDYGLSTALLVVAMRLYEGVSDICYGRMQREERLDLVGLSQAARGIFGLSAFTYVYYRTGSLDGGLYATCIVWSVFAVLIDMQIVRVLNSRSLIRPDTRQLSTQRLARLTRTAAPLGASAVLDSLILNVGRYLVEMWHGLAALGVFSAIAYLMVIGGTLVGAVGSAVTPRLARLNAINFKAFARVGSLAVLFGAAIGVAGVAIALTIGDWLLALVYGHSFAVYGKELALVMIAAAFWYIAGLLGCMLTAAGKFNLQLYVHLGMFVMGTIASVALIPPYGVIGACIGLCVAMLSRSLIAAGFVVALVAAEKQRSSSN